MNAPSDKIRKDETELAEIWKNFLDKVAAVSQAVVSLSPDKQNKK